MLLRAVESLRPRAQPWGSRQAYRKELAAAGTIPVALALIEGGTVGVLSKTVFHTSNFGFAAIAAAPMFANLTSLLWTRLARGRRRVALTCTLMSLLLAMIASIALLPVAGWGPAALVGIVITARCLLAGMITIRSTIWRHNFPRYARARIAGRIVLCASASLAVVPVIISPLLDWRPELFRVIYPAAAALGIVGVVVYSRLRVRQEPSLLRSEREPDADVDLPRRRDGRRHSFASVLREDQHFRSYMVAQFIAGVANMMGISAFALFIVESLKDHPNANTLSMTLLATVPLTVAVLTLPWWSRLLDATHIAQYRVYHGLTWIVGQSLCMVAAMTGQLWLFFLPQITQGAMRGGGMIAWELGHNDFADRRLAALYMGIHQTLTGVRGAFAPFLGVGLLAGWDQFAVAGVTVPGWAGLGAGVFGISTALCVVSWLMFVRLTRQLRREGRAKAADG